MRKTENRITIKEASLISGKSISTLYRYITKGKLPCKRIRIDDNDVIMVEKADLERLFNGGDNHVIINQLSHDCRAFSGDNHVRKDDNYLTKENFKELMEEFFETKQTQIMKPLEEQAIYIAGSLNKENLFLKERLEIILEENKVLREAMKALPGPVEKVVDELKEKDRKLEERERRQKELEIELQEKIEYLDRVKDEKEQLLIQQAKVQSDLETLQKEKSVYKEARAKYDELEVQVKEKDVKLLNLEQEKSQLEKEWERLSKLESEYKDLQEKLEIRDREKEELEAMLRKEKEELEARLLVEEERKRDLEIHLEEKEKEQTIIVDAWKKRVAELEKPWWKKLFGG